jgi:beta-lactamase class A
MLGRTPRQSGHRRKRGNIEPPPQRVGPGRRPYVLVAYAAILALVSATAIYTSAQMHSSAAEVRPAPADASASIPSVSARAATGIPSAPASPGTFAPVPAPEAPTARVPTPADDPVTPTPDLPVTPATAEPLPVPINAAVDAQINGIITANSRYQLGIALIDISDGVVHEYGVSAKFLAASTAKVLAAAAYYRFVETGRASLTATMGVQTAEFQIRQMIQQSNNQSWSLVVEAVGYQGLHDYAASLGISYDRALNTLTPAETARTLALLYTGKLLNGQDTGQLLSCMQHTNDETLIPAAVPPDITVFHKYGLLYGNLHDASILTRGPKAYAFVVYTTSYDMSDIPSRTLVIHDLTRAVITGLFPA